MAWPARQGELRSARGEIWRLILNGMLIVVVALVSAIGLGWLMLSAAPRLLGVRVGVLRAVLGALAGWLAAVGFVRLVGVDRQPAFSIGFSTLSVGIALLVAMGFLLLTEALRSGRRRPGSIVAAGRGQLARGRRYTQISGILVRHGLGGFLRGDREVGTARRLGRSLRQAMQEAGGTFVKLGQVLSTRPDLLPAEIVEELSHLQSEVAPAPWPAVRRLLAEELGAPVESVFAEFDQQPLAAASIAQVHRARLTDGTEVVVKVQRPALAALVERDLDILARLARRLHANRGAAAAFGVLELVDGFATALREELDFRIEAANIAAVAAGMGAGEQQIRLPMVHQALCTGRVLVMQRLAGVPLGAAGPTLTRERADRLGLARTLLDCVLRQVLVHGVFHADPHPGNILLLADGRLGLLDFGCVGRLDAGLRSQVGRLLLAAQAGDAQALCTALLEVTTGSEDIDEPRLQRSLRRFTACHLGPGRCPDVALFIDLFRLLAQHRLAAPPELAAVFRAMTTLEGTLRQLAPGFDLLAELGRFSNEAVLAELMPAPAARAAGRQLQSLWPVLAELPKRIDRIGAAIEGGRLSVQVRPFADERGRRFISGLVNQVVQTVLCATAGIMAVLLLGTGGGPMISPSIGLYQIFGYHLLLVAGGLGLRVLVSAVRTPSRR